MFDTRREFCQLAAAGLLWASAPGWARAMRSKSAPRRFRTFNAGSRWLLLDPADRPYWMLGVFNVDLSAVPFDGPHSQRTFSLAKYGNEERWARQAARRLRAWGFNCLAEYASEYALPIPLDGRAGNPERLPFMGMIRPAAFSLTNRWGFATAPVKDIVAATDPDVYRGWRGSTVPDVFDDNFGHYAHGEAAALAAKWGHSRYLVGITGDDADDLYGFGPGPELPAPRLHPHLGWLVLISNPMQWASSSLHVSYADPRLHSKFALQAQLRRKYGSMARLNQAWGSDYSGFGSDGGWPRGHGWLDESGRSPWLGKGERLYGASAALLADLDEFLGAFAAQYFQTVAGAVHGAFPGYLAFGPATLNGWNGLTRTPILRAAGVALDVVQANAGSDELLRATVAATGDVPLVTWTGMTANPDSDLYEFPHAGAGAAQFATQGERGAAYAAAVAGECERAVNGHCPVVGTKFWAFADSWPEKMNWGLVSLRDNAYDGLEAVQARGRNRWGYVTGGEPRNFGDCLSAITTANRAIAARLAGAMRTA